MRPPRNPRGPCLILCLAAGFASHARAGDLPSLGPLFEQFKLTLDLGHRTEVVSPLYYYQRSGEPGDLSRQWAAPPLFSYWRNEDVDYAQLDILWKAMTYNRYGEEYRFHLLQLFSFAGGQTQSETNVHRFTLFPIYFQQRSLLPGKDYTALFPIYGTIRQRLFRDEIRFALFPLYGQTKKRDVVTANYLYPVFHLRHGDGLRGWQFWPLLGSEHKEVTTRTNHWGDVEPVGGHDKLFVLWPLFFNHHTGIATTNEIRQQTLIPFYNHFRSEKRDLTSYGWPLGVTHIDDREKGFTEWGTPWPLIVFARGEGKHVSRVWPFYSQAHNATQTSDWYLWPVYKYNRLDAAPLDRERTRILFFLYSDASVRNLEENTRSRQIDCWPLFTMKRELDGKQRLQILSVVEPFLPNSTGVQRCLSPLWSLWRSERNPKTSAASQSLLWNLYRRDTAADAKKCSLLFGLFQYQSGPDGTRWRLFHIPLGGSRPAERQKAP